MRDAMPSDPGAGTFCAGPEDPAGRMTDGGSGAARGKRRGIVRLSIAVGLAGLGIAAIASARGAGGGKLPLTISPDDIFAPGTQPRTVEPPEAWMVSDPVLSAGSCYTCHGGLDDPTTTEKPLRWRGSMHAHSMRDPIFQAAFVIANQDAPGIGEFCIRCHSPRGWLEGRASEPTGSPDGSTLLESDIDEGVNCNVCHRVVNPVYQPGSSPADDELILNAHAMMGGPGVPMWPGNANYVIDPMDVRRGPFDDPAAPHLWLHSPLHTTGHMCGTCHDVSNPLFTRQGGATPAPEDTYVLNGMGAHPTQNKYDMFPEQRTYSEWLMSEFANGGVDMGGLFNVDPNDPNGPETTVVSSCQDCHMPNRYGHGCAEFFEPPLRNNVPYHGFVGANVFAVDLLTHLYGPSGAGTFDSLTMDALTRARTDTIEMLQKATDTYLTQFAGELSVRTVNNCGHKLMTGMPEGKRIWLNVQFFDINGNLVREYGAYDPMSAILDEAGTKVYEALLGLDPVMALLTGLPAGKSFHLALVNTIVKDNRIPPRGFNNAAFESVQAGHVGYRYEDGQYWDITKFCIPAGAVRAEAKLYYQTSTREYIEFLENENITDGRGALLASAWAAVGKSQPQVMDDVVLLLDPFTPADVTGDGEVSFDDVTAVLAFWGNSGNIGLSGGDANCDGVVDFDDITAVLANWGASVGR